MPTIEIQHLHFSYPQQSGTDPFQLTLDNWELGSGESAVLYGPSGCGKSTLLNLIAGTLDFSQGSLKVLGLELLGLRDSQKRAHRIQNIGFVKKTTCCKHTKYCNYVQHGVNQKYKFWFPCFFEETFVTPQRTFGCSLPIKFCCLGGL